MTVAAFYLPSILLLAALPFAVASGILGTRLADIASGRRTIAFYEEFDGTGASLAVGRPTRQLANLFEFPMLFYAAVAILIGSGVLDETLRLLCCSYAVLRWMHAVIHLLRNRLWLRTPVFAMGNLVLIILWIRMACLILA
jgi:hypothetical protein